MHLQWLCHHSISVYTLGLPIVPVSFHVTDLSLELRPVSVYRPIRCTEGDVMAWISTVAVTNKDGHQLCELQRQVRTCQRQLSQLCEDQDDERRTDDSTRWPGCAPPRTGRSTLTGRDGRGDGCARNHECWLRTLSEKVETQHQLLLLRLQRLKPALNAVLLDEMHKQQKRIAEVSW